MKNRKRGFSLVELLIVLAVIAALIATITPVALNAIRKSQATKVAQNIKTLASSFENLLYVEGKSGIPTDISGLGRDIDETKYNIAYSTTDNGGYEVYVWTSEEAHEDTLVNVLPSAKKAPVGGIGDLVSGFEDSDLGGTKAASATYYYSYTFIVY